MSDKESDTSSTDEKTRIYTKKPTSSAVDDRTVIQPNTRSRETIAPSNENDVTRIAKEPLTSDDKTRIQVKTNRPNKAQSQSPKPRRKPSASSSQVESSYKPTSFSKERVINRRFVLKESLGVGGMGMVFRALDLRKEESGDTEPYIAIKILTSEFNEHPQAFVSLQREAKKSQLLSHPNIIKVYDFDRDDDLVYLTMEELKGKPLDRLIREHLSGMPLDMALNIIEGISSGLAYAHQKNVAHADLKPENIFVTNEGEVKIIDFGIARMLTQLDGDGEYVRQFDPTEIVGLTPAYASLEMLDDQAAIPSDDLYALGAICYEVLTGAHPYRKLSAKQAILQKKELVKIKQIKSYQWKAISKALNFKQADRFKNAGEFHSVFTAKGRTVRNLTVGLAIVSIILAISLSIPRGQNTDHLYDDLTIEQQQSFDSFINEGNTLRDFGDWNNALSFYDQAFQILPQHSIIQESLEQTAENIIEQLESSEPALSKKEKLIYISELQKYKSLVDNARLQRYKEDIALGASSK